MLKIKVKYLRLLILFVVFLYNIQTTVYSQELDKLWLRYEPLEREHKAFWSDIFKNVELLNVENELKFAVTNELKIATQSLLNTSIKINSHQDKNNQIHAVLLGFSSLNNTTNLFENLQYLGDEGYLIKTVNKNKNRYLVIASKSPKGLLYAVFDFLKQISLKTKWNQLDRVRIPKNQLRMINHWDNPNGRVERGYAGNTIFNWNNMAKLSKRDTIYCRLMASMGMNAIVINNVNTKTQKSDGWKLLQSKKIDNLIPFTSLLHSYGLKTYISINFASPILIGGLETADPLNKDVANWWKDKAKECFTKLTGFGGFLIKADSEEEPGPITYGRNHAQGANVLANAVAPYNGLIIWRAFVYNVPGLSNDRPKHAFENFHPLDGKFKDNVIIQCKNGPFDFQVREPVAPLFGGLPNTNMTLELQISQEYTGQSTHLCYLVPQWKEALDFDTYSTGKGATVKEIVNGNLYNYKYSGVAGVINFGDDKNWTGHYLAQANTYGYGRLVWNPNLSSKEIAQEWIKLTFGDNKKVMKTISEMLLSSWETYELYTSPLGIGITTDLGHFKPDLPRRQGPLGISEKKVGIDRTITGTGYTEQYHSKISNLYNNLETIPNELLLFFHEVPYHYKLKSGKTVIQHIYDSHFDGVYRVKEYIKKWKSLKDLIDSKRYEHILSKLKEQHSYAEIWRDHVNAFFYNKSKIEDEKKRLSAKVKTMFK